ncbi:MAG: hypothetical protein LBT04_09480 [Prevotellaceae bacterium]|jgi:hypothetical protein|nr:hypothetical protein [Prevotellaceae bacterium]
MMKKIMFLLLVFICAGVAFGQQKVAVYVTGGKEAGDNEILGEKLVEAISQNQSYVAIERTMAFLQQLSKEQNYERSGNVDDDQLSRLGKQAGVQYVCAVNMSKSSYGGSLLAARLINVETGIVEATASKPLTNTNVNSLIKIAQIVAQEMLERTTEVVKSAPLWFFNPPKNEYVGVSLPLDNSEMAQQYAVYAALLSYVVQNEIEIQYSASSMSEEKKGIKTSKVQRIQRCNFSLPDSYTITKIAKNEYNELFVSIAVDNDTVKEDKIRVVFESLYKSVITDNAAETTKNIRYTVKEKREDEQPSFSLYVQESEIKGNVSIAGQIKKTQQVEEEEHFQFEEQQYRYTDKYEGILKDDEISGIIRDLDNSLGVAYSMALLECIANDSRKQQQQAVSAYVDASSGESGGTSSGSNIIVKLGCQANNVIRNNALFIIP